MSCYFRYLRDVFQEAGVTLSESNKRQLDQTIHAFVGVAYKHCMPAPPRDKRRAGPACWSEVKRVIQDAAQRARLITTLKRVR